MAGHDAKLPQRAMITTFLLFLEQELAIIRPKHIIAFGLIPFAALTGSTLKLGDSYDAAMNGNLPLHPCRIGFSRSKVIPCYFPVGRGNPKRAVEILRRLPT